MILIAAATPWEAAPLSKRLGLEKDRDSLFSGSVGRTQTVLIKTGIGSSHVKAALSQLDAPKGDLVVLSAGLAGALQPDVRSGDIVADLRGVSMEWVESARKIGASMKTRIHFGAMLSAGKVLGPEEKLDLGRSKRALSVDMESDALRGWANERQAAFMGARAVLDELDETIPSTAPNEGLAGSVSYAAHHWRELPSLIRLGLRQRFAMRRLGQFLEEWIESF